MTRNGAYMEEFDVDPPLAGISIDELQEQADEVGFLTPREFAKLVSIAPQQVYSWIRKGVIESERCKCGRRVVHVARAKGVVEERGRTKISIDTRSDSEREPIHFDS
jgi:hypothetical protein